jgi:alkylation response protein AidB-like acyl-CoA dehydrogenase
VDFELSEDQVALQEGVRRFCEGRFPIARVRDLEGVGVDRDGWAQLAEMGVFALRVGEADGGTGLGWAESVLAFEELGRALVPGPLVWTHLAAGLVEGAAEGTAVVTGLDVERPWALVEHGPAADVVVLLDDDGVRAVPAPDVAWEPVGVPLDPLTPVARATAVPDGGERIGGPELAAEWRLGGTALSAALALGVAEAVTDVSVGFAHEREQFGRPIGSFQAIKHLLADMVVRVELARAAVYAAGVVLDDPEVGDADRAVTAASLVAADAAIENGNTGVQVHGGMGYTWEVDVHLFLKRAYALAVAFGDRDEAAEAMAGHVVVSG